MSDLNIRKIVCGSFEANSYLVSIDGREDAFLVDAGDDPARLLDAIEKSGRKLTDILLTHGHFDHLLAASRVARATGARLRIHPLDADMLESAAAALFSHGMSRTSFEPIQADAPLTEQHKSVIRIAGIPVTLLHTPGHTLGGMSFYCANHGAVFTGDTLFAQGVGRTDLPGGDDAALRASLRLLLELPDEVTAYPGHEGKAAIGAIRRNFR